MFLHEFQRYRPLVFLFSSKHFYEPPTGWHHALKTNFSTLSWIYKIFICQ
jgi:hypothetical protein